MRFMWGVAGWTANAVRVLAAVYLWFMYFQFLDFFLTGVLAFIVSVLAYPGLFVVPFFGEKMQEVDGYSLEVYVAAIAIAILFGNFKNWCFKQRERLE